MFCVPLKKDSHKGLHFIIVWTILNHTAIRKHRKLLSLLALNKGCVLLSSFSVLFLPKNTYSVLICMRSYCKFWNVLFLLFYLIPFFHLFHNLGWITKGHAFLKAHMSYPCVLLRIQGETEGLIPPPLLFQFRVILYTYFFHIPILILTSTGNKTTS